MTDASCWLGPTLALLARKSTYASSWSLGFLTAWHLNSKGENRLRERDSKKLFYLFKPSFRSLKQQYFQSVLFIKAITNAYSGSKREEVDFKARGKGSVLEKQVGQEISLRPFSGKCDLLPLD